jgi:mannosyltransferase
LSDPTPTPETARPARLQTALLVAALVAFAALLTIALGRREFWTDEAVTAGHLASWRATRDAFHPRGYYALLFGWVGLFGAGDLSLRLFSVPWALLSLWLLWEVGRRVTTRPAAVLAVWLYALSPFVVLYFRMARFYSLMAAAFLLVTLAAVLVAQEGRRRHWTALALAAVALLNINYAAASLLAPLFVWLGVVAWRRGHGWRWLGSALPLVAMLGLIARTVLRNAGAVSHIESEGGTGLIRLLARLALPAYSLAVGETTDVWRLHLVLPALVMAGVAFLIGWRALGATPGGRAVRWAWPLAVGAVALVLSTVARAEPLASAARSTLFATPLAFLVVAAGILALRSARWRAVCLAVFLVVDGYGLLNYFTGRQFLNPAYVVPWRQVGQLINGQERPGDMVLCYFDDTLLRYAHFGHFILGRRDYFADRLIPVETWPACGQRLWLISRDRGSAQARRLQTETLARLTARAAGVQEFPIMRYPDLDRRVRELALRRSLPESYLTVYLFTPPPPARPSAQQPR